MYRLRRALRRVAIITDIHANLPALRASLQRIGGAVGKPKDGDPRAAFAVLELDGLGVVRAVIERVDYDAQTVAREVAAAGLPAEYADKLLAAA